MHVLDEWDFMRYPPNSEIIMLAYKDEKFVNFLILLTLTADSMEGVVHASGILEKTYKRTCGKDMTHLPRQVCKKIELHRPQAVPFRR